MTLNLGLVSNGGYRSGITYEDFELLRKESGNPVQTMISEYAYNDEGRQILVEYDEISRRCIKTRLKASDIIADI